MRELLIGDMHFGIKTNSVEWLNKQLAFMRTQLFDAIREEAVDRIVFLGDLTDVRYSINQQVGIELQNVVDEMSTLFAKVNPNGYIVFLAGNHDYYSPLEEYSHYNSYRLLFGEDFLELHPNVIFVDDEPLLKDDSLFLPWYWTENTEHFDELLYRYKFGKEVKCVYCHADLLVWPGGRIASLRGVPVYAGHIHNIQEDTFAHLYNIGAAAAFTMNDVNQDRYIYVVEDFNIVKKIVNTTTPRFIRIYNEEIFTAGPEQLSNAIVQICISKSKFNLAENKEQIKVLMEKYSDSLIRVHPIDDSIRPDMAYVPTEGMTPNIHEYIKTNIPDKYKSKFDYISTIVTNKQS